jgi:two-component system sensor histidine kinase UhpB
VEDDPEQAGLIGKILGKAGNGFELDWAPQLSEGLARLNQGGIDVVILDLGLPDSWGLETFTRAYEEQPGIPFVVLTGLGDEDLGIAAVRQGAQDYLVKGMVDGHLLSRSILYAVERRRAQEALLAERQRLYALLDGLPAAIYLKSPDYAIRFANWGFRERFGSPEGRRCYEIFYSKTAPCDICPAIEILRTQKSHVREWNQPDGKTYQIFYYPFHDVDGSPLVLTMGIDISERKQMEEALMDSEQKLRFLTTQLLTAQEDERRILSQGLHDELGHALLSMKLDLGAMEKQLLPEQTGLAENIAELSSYLDEVIENVRRLYLGLTPGDLEDLGLTAALKNLFEEFGRHQERISWSVNLENIDNLFSIRVETVVYRIFQEILTNIGKHADSTQVSIAAQRFADRAFFEVRDNGRGFDAQNGWQHSQKGGMGLLAMEERVRMLGGELQVWSREGQGTTITFTIPLEC